jgi:hypothetical protein
MVLQTPQMLIDQRDVLIMTVLLSNLRVTRLGVQIKLKIVLNSSENREEGTGKDSGSIRRMFGVIQEVSEIIGN